MMLAHTWIHCVRVTGPDNSMYCRMPEQITLFTRIDIQVISVGGELSDPIEIRLGELPLYIHRAEQSGRAVLMTSDGHDQADILEFLEKQNN